MDKVKYNVNRKSAIAAATPPPHPHFLRLSHRIFYGTVVLNEINLKEMFCELYFCFCLKIQIHEFDWDFIANLGVFRGILFEEFLMLQWFSY
jgi:hypothetical protein